MSTVQEVATKGVTKEVSIVPLQSIFYLSFSVCGAYMMFLAAQPVSQVEKLLGPIAEHVWTAILFFGPIIWAVGMLARGTRAAWVGMWMILCGDGFAFTATFIYSASVANDTPWGTGTFAPFLGGATSLCIAVLVLKDICNIAEVKKASKPISDEV